MSNFQPTNQIWRNGFNAGLQVRRNLNKAGGGGSTTGVITGNGTGFVYVYKNELEQTKVGGLCLWHHEGGQHYADKNEFIAEHASYFSPTDINYTSGSFLATDLKGNSYTLHGVKLLLKSGITMLVGYEDMQHIHENCDNNGYLWGGSNRAVIYGTNGQILWQYCNKGSTAYYGLENAGTYTVENGDIRTHLITEHSPGCMVLHGDPEYADNGTALIIYDFEEFSYIVYRGSTSIFHPEGKTVSFSNATTCYSASNNAAHMPCHLNCFINPEMVPDAERYKLYLTYDKDGNVVHDTFVPMSYLKTDILFNIYDPIGGRAYNCVKLCSNAMKILREIEPPSFPDINTLVTSFLATEGR